MFEIMLFVWNWLKLVNLAEIYGYNHVDYEFTCWCDASLVIKDVAVQQ